MNAALKALDDAKIQKAAKTLGQWAASDFQNKQACLAALNRLKKADKEVDVLLVCSDPVVSANVHHLIRAAHDPSMNMKTMHEFREHVDHDGGDQCYGPNFPQLFNRAAWYVYQILKNGASPATLAVYLPSPPFDQVPP
jgi:hypothetical protein